MARAPWPAHAPQRLPAQAAPAAAHRARRPRSGRHARLPDRVDRRLPIGIRRVRVRDHEAGAGPAGGAQPVGIDYMLEKGEQGWKVFDVIVAGVSLVTNYRSSFGQEISRGGIDGLIKSLEERNRTLAEQHGLQQAEGGRGA